MRSKQGRAERSYEAVQNLITRSGLVPDVGLRLVIAAFESGLRMLMCMKLSGMGGYSVRRNWDFD